MRIASESEVDHVPHVDQVQGGGEGGGGGGGDGGGDGGRPHS